MNIIEALDHPKLFGTAGVIRDPASWAPWRAFLKALFGLEMTDDEAALFRSCTSRETLPTQAFAVAWLCCGRRAGKSFVLALIAVFFAAFEDYAPYLSRGERATVMIIAADRKQARTIFRYIAGIMRGVPALEALIETENAEEMRLKRPVNIEVMTASTKSVRGYAVPVLLLDEAAFLAGEGGADADVDILASVSPAMKQFPAHMRVVLGGSSPYGRRGLFWSRYEKHYGRDSALELVWQAATRVMNPTIPQADIDREYENDPIRAAAEFGAEFRRDVEGYVSREVIEDVVIPKREELPPLDGARHFAFVDPSGGSADSMTMCISHCGADGVAVIDAVRERRPPFSPEGVTQDFAALLKVYKVNTVVGDRYAGEWPREQFRKAGITYQVSELTKSEIYRDALAVFNSKRVELLDNRRIVDQLLGLERRTSRGGRDVIDHSPGAHDDLVNSVCGAMLLAGRARPPMTITRETLDRFAARGPFTDRLRPSGTGASFHTQLAASPFTRR